MSILITGCNRGLGIGLIKCWIKHKNSPKNIIATCRNIENSKDLLQIANTNENIHIVQLDVTKTDTFDTFASDVGNIVGKDGLNVLFNNAGYSPKSTRINSVTAEQLAATYAVNTIGPIMLTKALLPLLKMSSESQEQSLGNRKTSVINMSSVLGSISLNDTGGLYPYRCSKAALNMATKSLSLDLKQYGILVTCIHPGWVKTDMGGSGAPLDVNTSAEGIIKFILNLSEKHNGEFYQFDGKNLQW